MSVLAIILCLLAVGALYVWRAKAEHAHRLHDARMRRRATAITHAELAQYARRLRRS